MKKYNIYNMKNNNNYLSRLVHSVYYIGFLILINKFMLHVKFSSIIIYDFDV